MANLSNINNKFLVTTGGNVGIGVTGPVAKLQVAGTTTYNSDTSQALRVCDAADVSKGIHIGFDTTQNAGIIQAGDFGVSYRDLSLNPNAGNVGIGTVSPATKLNIRSDASDDGILLEKSDGTDIARLFHDGTSTNARLDMFSGGSATIQLKANGITHFSGGNVGIGVTSPDQKLNVDSGATGLNQGIPATSGTSQNGILRLTPGDLTYGETLDFGMNVGPTYAWIQATNKDGLNTNYSLALNPNGGNVGIGETSPNGKLDIKQEMKAGTTAAFTDPHLRLSANNNIDNTGFVGMTFATSTANNYGFSWGALRTTSALGGMHLRYHGNSASGTDIFNIDYVGNVTIASTRYIRSDSSGGYLIIQGGATYPGGRIEIYGGSNAAAGIIFSTGTTTTSPAERMRIDSSGNLSLGTVTPFYATGEGDLAQISVNRVPSNGVITNTSRSAAYVNINGSDGGSSFTFHTANANNTQPTERMRITSGGNIDINSHTGATIGYGVRIAKQSGYSQIYMEADTTTSRILQRFYNPTGNVGNISIVAYNTTYSTSSSDERLKKNITNWDENILDKFKDIKPKEFHFHNQDDSEEKIKGYIAQNEVDKFPEAYPLLYNEEVGEDRHMFNPSGMVVYLMKAIQELKAEIELLKSK